jgi:Kef-type K+ transport system membrane component KefB
MPELLLPVGEVYKLVAFGGALYFGGLGVDLLGCPALVGEILIVRFACASSPASLSSPPALIPVSPPQGMLLGPEAAGLFSPEVVATLKIVGQLGLILMVIEGGISMDAQVLREKGARAVVLAATGTLLPVVMGWAVMLGLGHSMSASIASGIALSSTAIGFTMRMMTDMNLLETAEGQLITAAAMIDDVFSLILLSMLQVVQRESGSGEEAAEEAASGGASGGGGAWIVIRPLLASTVVTLIGCLCFQVVNGKANAFARLVERWPPRMRTAWRSHEREAMLLSLVGGGTLAAWLSEGFYSTLLLGAFCVGAAFCTQPLARDSWGLIAPLSAWTSRLFFGATVGFQVPVTDLFGGGNFGQGALLTLAAILGKWLSGAWGVSIWHSGGFAGRVYRATFMRVGCAMIGRGELGFQLAMTAMNDGILSVDAYSATIWALLLATLLGPYSFRLSMRLAPCGLEKPPPPRAGAVVGALGAAAAPGAAAAAATAVSASLDSAISPVERSHRS